MSSNLLTNSRQMRGKQLDEASKAGYMPTNKKLYNSSMFQNSREFTQLGTLAKENRTAEYYQPDIPPQPKPLQDANDLTYLEAAAASRKNEKQYAIGEQLRNEHQRIVDDNQRLVADKRQRQETAKIEEQQRFSAPSEGVKLDPNARDYDFLQMENFRHQFPATSNQEFLSGE